MPYTEEILKYLKEREYLLALGTNRPAVFTNLIIEHLGINKLFDYVVCGDELEAFKPNPEMILKTLEKFDLDITEIVYVGDMVIDLETASNAGVRSIAITTGSNSREELVAGDPFAIIDSLDQLEDFF